MSAAVSPTVAPPPADPVRIAVLGRSRWALWWRDELADDPRFALLEPDDADAPEPDATLRGDAGRVTIEVPHGPDADSLPFRPARFTAAFAAARSAVEYFETRPLSGTPRDFTLVEHTQTPLGPLEEHGTAVDRLEARLDELLALSEWTAPRVVHATRIERGEETTLAVRLEDAATGGTALIEIVRGAAVRWESGWSLRTPAGAYHEGTLTTREPGGELAARPWTGEASSPLNALHAWLAHGEAWPVTAEQTQAVAALMKAIAEKTPA
ncbi:hypothetical protein [Alienimonas californiensis]|uniref:Uncharacterized protein n=1 Tax=Alienimonas californiensis TaxID=2527989 RepID=A0A517P7G0_9PLAN|nr:hypothetical protein [Alienimonas californiensis]QDT15309.1 hypothetical protein CA12_13920 [Alienimonas californiensis]